jgi:hypothetical protein
VINARHLLADLTRLLKRLEDDLRHRIAGVPELKVSLQREWQTARDADRTAETFESWADQVITQAGVHWLLSCVFLRFIEDNELVERPWLGGTPASGRLGLARDQHEAYFRGHPLESDRDYLLAAFREAGALPGLHTFFDEAHNPLFRLGISGDAAMAVRQFWQQVDPNTGSLLHDFTDADWNTRFLGDLYQDLSEAARKRYALLQTPEFVEEFILDRALTPAISEFGYRDVRMIDPTCGSGHFLLGGFKRLLDEWARHEPARNSRDVAQRALDAIAGVDLNPFAVAISRFRLLVMALKASGVHRLVEAPDFKLNVAIGDSLLHGKRFGLTATEGMFEGSEHYAGTGLAHAYAGEDLSEVQRILGRQYHAVVGNPPYIVVKDAALNAAYRRRYTSCHRQYSLGAPFTERFFDLACTACEGQAAGFVGLITTNSFMKREFGSKLIEEVLPRLDLTHVIDTSGAYIPGHGTPTVILFGRHRRPVGESVRTVMGIKGEPTTPDDPAHGLVWSAIVGQIDVNGSESAFVSVADTPRSTFSKHPWSLGGGGAAELRDLIEEDCRFLSDLHADLGFLVITGEDNCLIFPAGSESRLNVSSTKSIGEGDTIRDWCCETDLVVLWPYDDQGNSIAEDATQRHRDFLWPYRTTLKGRKAFCVPVEEKGLKWWDIREVYRTRLGRENFLAYSFVATHNHFVVEHGQKVFKQSAPVIQLPKGANLTAYEGLVGLLNSSLACFWMKQIFHNKGSTVDTKGARQRTDAFEDFYEFTSTGLKDFPIAEPFPQDIAARIDELAHHLTELSPRNLLASSLIPTRAGLDEARGATEKLVGRMIALQEELDWRCYRIYGVLPNATIEIPLEQGEPPVVALGERAFEIVIARRAAAGREATTWFERHASTPITEIPSHWPTEYRRVVQHRIEVIESDKSIALIERPEFKRRWNSPQWRDLEQAALRDWLLANLEAKASRPPSTDRPPQITTTSRLAETAQLDDEFMHVAELYAGHTDFDVAQLVAELAAGESVPFLPALRYTDTGLRKRAQWEDTWVLQRREDAGENFGTIPVPPKYQSKDFLRSDFWRLRGSLDVPKERWISYPGCERGADQGLPIAWAGWNHLHRAMALAAYYLEMKDSAGWEPSRLQPLLAGLHELVPWLEQWHNEVDPAYGERMGTYYKGFVAEEARALGFTLDSLKKWSQPKAAETRRRTKAAQSI